MASKGIDLQHRALYAVADFMLSYIDKSPKNMIRLVNIAQKLTGSMFPPKTYTVARDVITNENNIWHDFLFRGLKEIDRGTLKKAVVALGLDAGYYGTKAVRANREKFGCNIPWVILLDPTSACNLKCKGCWSAEYGHKQQLSLDEMRGIVKQGKALGTHFYMFTGGEPLIRRDDVLTLCKENTDCVFLAFTNATLVDQSFCESMREVGNLSLAISVEGSEETNDERRGGGTYGKVMAAMDLLKKNKCLFGLSVCYTSRNCEAVLSDEFIDKMIEKGSRFAWYFHYMPVGSNADVSLMPSPQQREAFYYRLRSLRSPKGGKPMFLIDFQNDSEFVGGCIAGGRNYFHVNSAGDIEPCVFVHYSDSNIRKDTLLTALKKPLFMSYYKNQPFNDNMLRPCPMLENPQFIEKMVKSSNAHSTDLITPESVDDLCAKCAKYSENWEPTAEKIWRDNPHFNPYTQYYRDTPQGKADKERLH